MKIATGTSEGDLVEASTPLLLSSGPQMFTSIRCHSGVVGLAAARRLAALGYRVTVLETESDSDHHTSARGSWVIHSGLYYPLGSLKVGGMHMLRLRCPRGAHLTSEWLPSGCAWQVSGGRRSHFCGDIQSISRRDAGAGVPSGASHAVRVLCRQGRRAPAARQDRGCNIRAAGMAL